MAKQKRDNEFFRNLPSRVFWQQELTEDFRRFYTEQVQHLIQFTGYKLDQKHEVARHIVNNLILAAFPEMGVVADARDTGKNSAARVAVWDAILAAGLAEVCVGAENKRRVTRYRATCKLLELREMWELRLVSDEKFIRNTSADVLSWLAPVVLHTGRTDPATGKPLAEADQRQLIRLPSQVNFDSVEDLIERINRSNTSHAWQAFTFDPESGRDHVWEPSVRLRQIHVGEPFRATRLYTCDKFSAQNISHEGRRKLLIDGEAVCELDFSCMAIRMLYHQHLQDPKGDLYRPERIFPVWHDFENVQDDVREVVRDFIKRVTNIALNVRSRAAAIGAVTKALSGGEERLLRRVLKADTLGVGSLLDRVVHEVHGGLREAFYKERGLSLMSLDGTIMLGILSEFVAADKPCLPLHDGVVVKVSDFGFARRIMMLTYHTYIGYDPVIQRSF